jgi:dipeptidyl aminopeptidase/acylaminoacyl peptidase
MKRTIVVALFAATAALAQQTPSNVPSNLVVEGVPAFSESLVTSTRPYLEYRAAAFQDWNPARAEMVITTRFGDTAQLHIVKMPGGDRHQITFFEDRTGNAKFSPRDPSLLIFSKDIGGAEQFQLYRYDLGTGKPTLLTDGKSRNTDSVFAHDGKWLAYSSTRRNGKDTDIYIVDPADPSTTKLLLQVEGGGWSATDFSRDDSKLLLSNGVSAQSSEIDLFDIKSGAKTKLVAGTKNGEDVANSDAHFLGDGDILYTTDEGTDVAQLVRLHLADGKRTTLSREKWEVEDFELSPDGKQILYVTNEDGVSVFHLIDAMSGAPQPLPKLPLGVVATFKWHPTRPLIGFTFSSAKSPADAWSIDLAKGMVERWTESETGGLDPQRNVEPQLVTFKSFDGLPVSAFVYRPDPEKWPGKRPALMVIHGGPEGQSQPVFLGRNNYWINELGIALVFPNVRGSTGYGKKFIALDNGTKREDSVKDIGALINWIKSDPTLDGDRIGVYGGSYGGYMTLATMTHYNESMKAAIDVVGISNFVTLLTTTSDYRRDLRRVEYGDESDPKMREFLEKISPLASASKITKPLFVIAGFNDPRVPYTEGQQIVKAVRANNAPVWWLMAKDEGHGFAKKKNADYQFLAMTEFLKEYL